MAKQGQHHDDARDSDVSRGHNDPTKSQIIVTGSYKKQETYRKQAAEHNDPGKQAQAARNDWRENTRAEPNLAADMRTRHSRSSGSSDSNAGSGTGGQ